MPRILGPVALALAMLVLATGCSRKTKRDWKFHSVDEATRAAAPEDLSASHPDQRRQAVAWLSEHGHADREEVFYVLDAVARTDPVAQIRCIAIRGLSTYEDARPVSTMLKILQAGENSGEGATEALPANDDVRWEAVRALAVFEDKGVLDERQRELARDIFIRLAAPNTSRNVRLIALDALGWFHDRRVFQPLIVALRDRDFAAAERGERSLIRLTGVSHQYNADAWETWLAGAQDPFARAGEDPGLPKATPPGWWTKQKRAFRRALKLGNTD